MFVANFLRYIGATSTSPTSSLPYYAPLFQTASTALTGFTIKSNTRLYNATGNLSCFPSMYIVTSDIENKKV